MYMGQQDLIPSQQQQQQYVKLQHPDTDAIATTLAETTTTTPLLHLDWCSPALYDSYPAADDVLDLDLDYASPTTSAATLSTTPSPRFDQAVPFDVAPTGAHSGPASFLPSPASSSCFSPPPPEQLMSHAGRMIATQQQQQQPAAYGGHYYGGAAHNNSHHHHNPRLLDTSVGGSGHHGFPRHNRDSSLSSLGSAGPASPLPFHRGGALGPHIAVADSGDGFTHYGPTGIDDITNQIYSNSAFGGGKSVAPSTMSYHPLWRPQTAAVPQQQQQQQQHGVMHPPRFGASQNGRGTGWGAAEDNNNNNSGLAPAGAAAHNMGRKPYGELGPAEEPASSQMLSSSLYSHAPVHEPPKFSRTVTDAQEDALYIPPTDTPARADMHLKTPHRSASGMPGGYDQRIQHLQSLEPNTTTMGGLPPSPPDTVAAFARPMTHADGTPTNPGYHFRSLTDEPQERAHVESDSALGSHSATTQATEQPQTMSPQDAMLQYSASNDDFGRLFDNPAGLDLSGTLGLMPLDHHHRAHPFQFAAMPQMPAHRPLHPSQQQHSPQSVTHLDKVAMQPDSAERPAEQQYSTLGPLRNPNMDSNEKTYTCTYHGCDERFDSQKELQKHKRDAHRPPNGHQPMARAAQLSTQAGPHRCNRINPSTNRPCNTEFSRPYDLTRHEDTMHNVTKRKYRCPYCTTDNKTFSRRDALTRHHRVAHGIDTSRRRQRQQAAAAAAAGVQVAAE
jgi:hypothetical protein